MRIASEPQWFLGHREAPHQGEAPVDTTVASGAQEGTGAIGRGFCRPTASCRTVRGEPVGQALDPGPGERCLVRDEQERRGSVAEGAIQLPMVIASFGVVSDRRYVEEQSIGVAEECKDRLRSAPLEEPSGRDPGHLVRTERRTQLTACDREGGAANGLVPPADIVRGFPASITF
ncbi:hypothetical protein ACWF76_15000 [Streptomyces globisporus]